MNRRLLLSVTLATTVLAALAVSAALSADKAATEHPQSSEPGHRSGPLLSDASTAVVEPKTGLLVRPDPGDSGDIADTYGSIPLHFEPNLGQTDPRVAFTSRAPGFALFLTPTRVTLALEVPVGSSMTPDEGGMARVALGMEIVGASPAVSLEGLDPLEGKSNYFVGAREDFVTGVPHFKRSAYRDVYPGIDLLMYGSQGLLEYDFIVAAGADPGQIELAFKGAEDVRIDELGNLVVALAGGELIQRAPIIYQEAEGPTRVPVGGRFQLEEEGEGSFKVRFQVEEYDRAKTLVIDPILSYSTFLGGSLYDNLRDMAVDSAGNAYVAGWLTSSDFPTVGAYQPTHLGGSGTIQTDGFITKINPTGSAIVYSTYLGTYLNDPLSAIAVDSSGSAYVVGTPGTANFPTAGTPLPLHGAAMYITKFNPAGDALVYSHILGGTTGDVVEDIAVDSSGNAYITGRANSADLPTENAIQPTKRGTSDAFVTKINADASAFIYSTYLGGWGNNERGTGIAMDASGNAYVVGYTDSSDFPTVSPAQATLGGGLDAFVMKLSADGSTMTYSTYLGGFANEDDTKIDIDAAGKAYVSGTTGASDFPTVSPAVGT
jgi:hypothetical protein